MSVQVRFLGLCLFRRPQKGEDFLSVLLPNALNATDQPHIDGTKARRHYAYFLSPEDSTTIETGDFEVREGLVIAPLLGTTIGFDTSGGSPALSGFTDSADFSKFAECLDMNPEAVPSRPEVLAGIAELRGGQLVTAATSRIGPWHFDDALWPGHTYSPDVLAWEIVWDTGMERVTVELASADGWKGHVIVEGDATMTIGNVCEPDPTTWDYLPETPCPGEQTVTDDDFKWLYRLFTPCGGVSWEKRLDGRMLPAPQITCPGAAVRGISTPTCYGGSCC